MLQGSHQSRFKTQTQQEYQIRSLGMGSSRQDLRFAAVKAISMADSVLLDRTWKRIRLWLGNIKPLDYLPEGVSPADISRAEAILGFNLPKELKSLYKTHNGTNGIWLCEYGCLMPLISPPRLYRRKRLLVPTVCEKVSAMGSLLRSGAFDPKSRSQPNGPIKTDWWSLKWLPITDNKQGDHVCIDLDPAKGGRKGQVINWWHERGATQVLSMSIAKWLETVANDLESGEWIDHTST